VVAIGRSWPRRNMRARQDSWLRTAGMLWAYDLAYHRDYSVRLRPND
jgi:hypothetical protein